MKTKHYLVIFLIWILGFICVFSNTQTPESTQKKSELVKKLNLDELW